MLNIVAHILIFLVILAPLVRAQSTIDPNDRAAYAANAGWIDFRPSALDGVKVTETYLSGYAYAANFGWIGFGDGSPDNGYHYENNSNTNWGVNLSVDGKLTGLAWSANTGWISFGQNQAVAVLNFFTGAITGTAYSANLRWISLNTPDSALVTTVACPDTDNDGISDAYESFHFGNLAVAHGTTDSDGDGQSDVEEYIANTSPVNPAQFLSVSLTAVDPGLDEVSYQVTAGPGRLLRVQTSSTLLPNSWSTVTDYPPLTSFGTIPDDFSYPTSQKRFFRVIATKPLQP